MKTTPWSKIKNKSSPEKIKEIKEVARKEAKEMATKTLQVTKEVTIGFFLKELFLEELKKNGLEIYECPNKDNGFGFHPAILYLSLFEEVAEKFYKECEKNINEERNNNSLPPWQQR